MNSSSNTHNNFNSEFEIVKEGEKVTVRRREKGKYSKGRWVSSNRFEEFEVQGSFQPMSGRETMQLAEGDRLKSHIKFYTEFEIKRDDLLIRDDEQYEVQLVFTWGTFTKSIARLVDVERN